MSFEAWKNTRIWAATRIQKLCNLVSVRAAAQIQPVICLSNLMCSYTILATITNLILSFFIYSKRKCTRKRNHSELKYSTFEYTIRIYCPHLTRKHALAHTINDHFIDIIIHGSGQFFSLAVPLKRMVICIPLINIRLSV